MKVIAVSCGENHTLAMIEIPQEDGTKANKLFVWGNNDKLQLGMENHETHEEDTMSAKEINVPHQLDPDPFQDNSDDHNRLL